MSTLRPQVQIMKHLNFVGGPPGNRFLGYFLGTVRATSLDEEMTLTFDTPVTEIQVNLQALTGNLGNLEIVSFDINGVPFNLTSSTLVQDPENF